MSADPILAIAARRKAQTHCDAGHEFTNDNTIVRVDNGFRRCRTCHNGVNSACYFRRCKRRDGIIDEVALERALAGDAVVYAALTKQEHTALVRGLADQRQRGERPRIPFTRLADAVGTELQRREKRR